MVLIQQAEFRKAIASLFLLTGSMFCGLLLAQDKHIDLSVVEVDGAYKMQFANSECPERPNMKGCVLAAHGNAPNITWELDSDSNQDWMLSSLMFSPDGVNWGDPSYPLADCTMEDFQLQPADRDSGVASSAQVIANGRMLKIKDRNYNECTTYYLLQATSRSSGEEIDSDPVITNRGGGPR